MKKAFFLLLVFFVMYPAAVMAGTTQCAKYHLRMEGTSSPLAGYTYTEIVEMHKVGQSSGYNGKWQIDRFTQINTYPHLIRPPVYTFNIVQFGDGQWMYSEAHSSGNVLTVVSFGGELYLDVLNNRIGSRKYGNWSGSITGKTAKFKFDPNNGNEPVITGEIRTPEKKKLTLSIVSPANDKFAFNWDNPGVMEMEFQAKVTPTEYEQDIQWTFPEIQGSTRTMDPPSGRGPHVRVTYKGLPEDNNEFGPKTVQAVVNVGGCQTEETRKVKVFYIRDAKNNPGGQDPNWLYYWKQTPAAKPRGQFVNIEYGGNTFGSCADPNVPAQYTPNYAHCTIHICDLRGKLGVDFATKFPLLSLNSPYHLGWSTSKHIDTFAVAVIHEFTHWQAWHNWRHGKTLAEMNAADTDQDGVPNSVEPSYDFDPDVFQTHFGNDPVLKNIGGDEEWLAYMSMSEITFGTLDKYDWGRPGKNWP
jgi:hypothetical protein